MGVSESPRHQKELKAIVPKGDQTMKARRLVAFDSLAGLSVGIASLILYPFIAGLHNWSTEFTLFIALTNVAYGCYSGILSLVYRKTTRGLLPFVVFLVIANSAWTGHCLTQIFYLSSTSNWTGLGHLLLEAVFVGVLAFEEAVVVLPALRKDTAA